jgi:hypothetical protein
MEHWPLRLGDRVEWTGPSHGSIGQGPQHGERGWLIMVDPADDIIMFDVCGHQTANYIHSPDLRLVRNEADPEKWLPGDPFGPATAPFDEKDIQTVRRWLKEAELAVQLTVSVHARALVLSRSFSYGVWPPRAPCGRLKL